MAERMKWSAVYELVGMALRAARDRAGLTQAQVAERVSLTRTSLANIEAGRQRASLDVLYNIAEATGVELRELMPTREDIERARIVPIKVGHDTYTVPQAVAQHIEKLLQAASASEDTHG